MLLYIITWTIIYFILILILHHLYLFFQKNLTSTKIKDYYNFPNKEYNKINNILNYDNKSSEILLQKNNIANNNDINNINMFHNYENNIKNSLETNNTFDVDKFNLEFNNNNMKGELEEFLNKLNN